jgi:o-succinylbenzoate synthase
MKIVKMEIRKLALPMVHSFKTGFGEITHKETVITKLHTADGMVGYGESSSLFAPIYNHETNDTCVYMQEKFIAPRIVGRDFATPEEFRAAYATIVGNRTAQTGPECAFWHLVAQRDNKSLKELVGGVKKEIPVGESIGIKPSIEETLREIEQRISEGYVRIKVKVKPNWDIEVLTAIRDRWPDINLTVDGNSAYSLDEDEDVLRSFGRFNLTMLEQPFATDRFVDHAKLQENLKTPICFDEGIESVEGIRTANALGSCKVVNLKPGRVGGLIESIKIHDFAAAHNMGVWCGGMLETGIGRAFNIALASKENFVYPADMSPYQLYFAEDIVQPSFVVKPNGHVDVPDAPGLGYEINDDQIEKFTVEKVVVHTQNPQLSDSIPYNLKQQSKNKQYEQPDYKATSSLTLASSSNQES